MVEIGTKIRELREEKKMSQKELADVLHVTPQAVSKWELNKSYPDLDTLLKLSQYFGVSSDEVLGNAKKSFFESLLSKMKGSLDMENITNKPIPKAEVVQVMGGSLKIFFNNGVEKYLKTHALEENLDSKNKGEKREIPKFFNAKITIKEDGTVILNDEDVYTPDELWYKSSVLINARWAGLPFSL